MTTECWIAKFVADPFRGETKNVGVFVRHNDCLATKLIGIREDGVADNRKIRGLFSEPDVFNQWQSYWQRCTKSQDLDAILKGTTANFSVVEGGSLSDAKNDPIDDVCNFLYSLVVSESGATAAFGLNQETTFDADGEAPSSEITPEVSAALESSLVSAGLDSDNNPHPILKNYPVTGRSAEHRPSFSQQNGKLYVIESIDLSVSMSKQKTVRERAGWMAFMFSDIKDFHPETQSISIIRPERGEPVEAVRFVRQVLSTTSEIVDWSNDDQRRRFLQERTRVAISLG